MRLNLNKPICFFDLETTGTNPGKDKIVEIACVELFNHVPTGKIYQKYILIGILSLIMQKLEC